MFKPRESWSFWSSKGSKNSWSFHWKVWKPSRRQYGFNQHQRRLLPKACIPWDNCWMHTFVILSFRLTIAHPIITGIIQAQLIPPFGRAQDSFRESDNRYWWDWNMKQSGGKHLRFKDFSEVMAQKEILSWISKIESFLVQVEKVNTQDWFAKDVRTKPNPNSVSWLFNPNSQSFYLS